MLHLFEKFSLQFFLVYILFEIILGIIYTTDRLQKHRTNSRIITLIISSENVSMCDTVGLKHSSFFSFYFFFFSFFKYKTVYWQVTLASLLHLITLSICRRFNVKSVILRSTNIQGYLHYLYSSYTLFYFAKNYKIKNKK